MKRSTAISLVNMGSVPYAGHDTTSRLQQAETLQEINEKTLTLRDQFALAAMQSLLSTYGCGDLTVSKLEYAYKIADMMMEARK